MPPRPGYDYTDILCVFSNSSPDPLTLSKWLVSSYDNYYKKSGESYTLCAVDLNQLTPAVTETNAIAQLLTTALGTDSSGKLYNAITASADPSACPHFEEPTYLDLYIFYANLSKRTSKTDLKSALTNGMAGITQAVIANAHSSEFAKVRGLSIYFADPSDGAEPSYGNLYWTTANPAWANFLGTFVNASGY